MFWSNNVYLKNKRYCKENNGPSGICDVEDVYFSQFEPVTSRLRVSRSITHTKFQAELWAHIRMKLMVTI